MKCTKLSCLPPSNIFLLSVTACDELAADTSSFGCALVSYHHWSMDCHVRRSPENIILYGQSMGMAPTVDLASRYECAAVVLHSPLMSGWRVSFPDSRKTYYFDAFPGIDKISKVTSPMLVIHGTEDDVIDFSHGLAMYELCPQALELPGVERAGHNDIELYAQYLGRIRLLTNFPIPEDNDLILPL